MKKMLLLLLAFGVFATAFAQHADNQDAKRVILGPSKRSAPSSSTQSPKNVILGRNNTVYRSTNHNDRASHDVYYERNEKYNKHGKRHDDDDDDDRGYQFKKDNGRHLGWEKGRGNPHRNGNGRH